MPGAKRLHSCIVNAVERRTNKLLACATSRPGRSCCTEPQPQVVLVHRGEGRVCGGVGERLSTAKAAAAARATTTTDTTTMIDSLLIFLALLPFRPPLTSSDRRIHRIDKKVVGWPVCGGWGYAGVALCVHSQGKLPAPSCSSDLLSNPRKLARPHHLHPLLASSFELLVGTRGYTSDLVHWIRAFLLEVENLIELAHFRVAPRGRYPSEPSCPRTPSRAALRAPSRYSRALGATLILNRPVPEHHVLV